MKRKYFHRPNAVKEGRSSSSVSSVSAMDFSNGGWMNAMNVNAALLMPAVPAKMSAMNPEQKPQSRAAERDVPKGKVSTMSGHNKGAP